MKRIKFALLFCRIWQFIFSYLTTSPTKSAKTLTLPALPYKSELTSRANPPLLQLVTYQVYCDYSVWINKDASTTWTSKILNPELSNVWQLGSCHPAVTASLTNRPLTCSSEAKFVFVVAVATLTGNLYYTVRRVNRDKSRLNNFGVHIEAVLTINKQNRKHPYDVTQLFSIPWW